jgi:ComEC/Rec2-related protein
MTDSALRRPLLWLLLAYMALLAVFREKLAARAAAADLPLHRSEAEVRLRVSGPAREDRRGWKGEVEGLEAFGEALPYRLQVLWPKGAGLDELPLPGDEALVRGWLRLPRPGRNPGDFDEAGFLAERGVAWVLEAESWSKTQSPPPFSARPRRAAELLRRSVRRALWRSLSPGRARLAEGLILGYKGALEPGLARDVRDAGLIHLLVPSGAKIAICAAFVFLLASALSLGPWARLACAGLACAAVTLAAGAEPPYTRALLGVLLAGAARAAGREGDAFQALIVSAWLILLWEPRALFSAGFQMTYLAMLGILALAPRWGLGVSAAVQASLWPIFATTFGVGTAAGVLVNAAVVPLYPALAAGAWLVWVCPWAGAPLGAALEGFARLCSWAAGFPGAAIPLSPWPWTSWVGWELGLIALPRLKRRSGRLIAALGLAFWAGGWGLREIQKPPLRIVFLKAPPKARRARRPALLITRENKAFLTGDVPPALLRKALAALDIARLDGRWSCSRRAGTRLGAVDVGFCPPRVSVGGAENAIIARLRFSSVEVATDGVEVHEGFPR